MWQGVVVLAVEELDILNINNKCTYLTFSENRPQFAHTFLSWDSKTKNVFRFQHTTRECKKDSEKNKHHVAGSINWTKISLIPTSWILTPTHLQQAVILQSSYSFPYARAVNRELKNHDEVYDDDVCWPGKHWNENVSFGGK